MDEKEKKELLNDLERRKKLKEDIDLYKKGTVAGTALATIGGLSYGLPYAAEKLDKILASNPKAAARRPKLPMPAIQKLKGSAPYLTAGGLAVAGISKYRHYKTKKKEAEENDNSEK